ncbi:PASTA domain-containing protein [Fluviicola taffensis]|uniref:PASTA domain-containing protein n=1 Tax=Fluviicola taffensis TaxID=191579 RepID=UPI00313810E7
MIEFDQLILKLKLYNSLNEPVDGMVLNVQYYSFPASQWVNAFSDMVETGEMLIVGETATTGNVAEMDLYALIESGKLPPMRVVPRDKIGGREVFDKQPVIGSSFVFNLEVVDGETQFVIDFGTLYMVPNELIVDSSSTFADILPVTNYFPVNIEQPAVPPVPIQDLYTNIVSEIASASETSIDSPFKLSNISLKLKALIHEDGGSMSASLLNFENSENVNGDAISELVFDITPAQNRQNGGIGIPNLIGLTETAVRKVLKKQGLKLNPVYQKKDSVVNGDSFKQFPQQGVSAQPNQLVTVIFSKHE